MRFNIKALLEKAKKDYESAWMESRRFLRIEGRCFRLKPLGKSNEIMDFIEEVRRTLVEMGFEEVILPVIVNESEVYKEYGPEAPIILDRVFYLAGLPRPDIGLSKDKIRQIKEMTPSFNRFRELQRLFRRYKKGEIEADDLVEAMVKELELTESDATKIIDGVFQEFKELKPIPSSLTLRSHMTALWFPVLSEIYRWRDLPVQLFTVGQKFRREQRLDAVHLYSSFTASLVIMTDEITLDDGKEVVREFLRKIGFSKAEFRIKDATSKYYAPRTEFEVFIQHPETKEWIEVGDCGFYSPVSLAKYGIGVPVFNAGFGLERFVMIRTGETDIRRLTYPYFYKREFYLDEEIAESLSYAEYPETGLGREIMNALINTAEANKDADAPCEFTAWKGNTSKGELTVSVFETEKGVKLLGPAALNVICVENGNILGLPLEKAKGVRAKLRYLDGLAALFARKVEKEILNGEKMELSMRVKMVKSAADINLLVRDNIRFYLTSKNKKIDVRGPVFIGFSARLNR